jgi:hypothetical protein
LSWAGRKRETAGGQGATSPQGHTNSELRPPTRSYLVKVYCLPIVPPWEPILLHNNLLRTFNIQTTAEGFTHVNYESSTSHNRIKSGNNPLPTKRGLIKY